MTFVEKRITPEMIMYFQKTEKKLRIKVPRTYSAELGCMGLGV